MEAVEAAFAPAVVGCSVEPKPATISEMPAAEYCDLIVDRWSAVISCHSAA